MPLITVSEGTPLLPPDSYPATLVGIAPKRLVTQYSKNGEEQDFLEWTWLVEGPEKDVEITSLTTLATGPKSKIMGYLVALVGAEKAQVGAGFDENDLVGKKVTVQTIVDDKGFSKIDNVVGAPKQRARPAQTTPSGNGAAPEAPVAEAPAAEAPQVEAVPEDDLPF